MQPSSRSAYGMPLPGIAHENCLEPTQRSLPWARQFREPRGLRNQTSPFTVPGVGLPLVKTMSFRHSTKAEMPMRRIKSLGASPQNPFGALLGHSNCTARPRVAQLPGNRAAAAPDYIIASHITDGLVDRTRPICPYPKVARWSGSGSSDDAKKLHLRQQIK